MADVTPEDIRELRKRKGLTQPQVAEGLGVSLSAIKQLETGKKMPGLELITKMSSFFGVTFQVSEKNKHPLLIKKEGA